MRPSTLALSGLALLSVACVSVVALSCWPSAESVARWQARRALAEHYGLTDLALFTEARYTRHPSQADLHSAFQDHPAAFEHFPSGSLRPPRRSAFDPHAPLAGKTAPLD